MRSTRFFGAPGTSIAATTSLTSPAIASTERPSISIGTGREHSDTASAISRSTYLIQHEQVEKTLIDQLGLHYLHAHQIATCAEQAAVRAGRILWHDYDSFMQKYVKRIGDERLAKVPVDLDLKPFRDEHDYDLMGHMMPALEAGMMPAERHSDRSCEIEASG